MDYDDGFLEQLSIYIYTYTNVRLSQTNLNDPPKGIPTNTDTSFGELVT